MLTYLSAANIQCQPGHGQYFPVELVVPVVCRHDRGSLEIKLLEVRVGGLLTPGLQLKPGRGSDGGDGDVGEDVARNGG